MRPRHQRRRRTACRASAGATRTLTHRTAADAFRWPRRSDHPSTPAADTAHDYGPGDRAPGDRGVGLDDVLGGDACDSGRLGDDGNPRGCSVAQHAAGDPEHRSEHRPPIGSAPGVRPLGHGLPDPTGSVDARHGHTLFLSLASRYGNGTPVLWRTIADAPRVTRSTTTWWAGHDGSATTARPLYFLFSPEPEMMRNDDLGTSSDFIDAWRRVWKHLPGRGGGERDSSSGRSRTKPSGSLASTRRRTGIRATRYVDAIGADAYNWHNCKAGFPNGPWKSFFDVVNPLRLVRPEPSHDPSDASRVRHRGGSIGARPQGAVVQRRPGPAQVARMGIVPRRALLQHRRSGRTPACNFRIDSERLLLDGLRGDGGRSLLLRGGLAAQRHHSAHDARSAERRERALRGRSPSRGRRRRTRTTRPSPIASTGTAVRRRWGAS